MKENPEELNNNGILLSKKGMFLEAISCFKRAITLNQKNYLFWYNLGITYRDSGQLKKAKSALEKSFQLYKKDSSVVEMLAIVCLELEDYDNASNYCYDELQKNSNNYNLWNTVGVIAFKKQDYNFAATCFEMSLSINPYNYDSLYNLKDTYDELGNNSGKLECEQKLKELKRPNN